ncbi:MAG TPA: VCBS repeat-containing protein [Kofleriaceae bacterium]|nr:VCBS repeat-containing protein [Kofleriaceae bacterium]
MVGDGKSNSPDGFGLHDFNNDGLLDLYLCNQGQGGTRLKNPRPPFDLGAVNKTSNDSFRDAGYRTQISNGDGTFAYRELGANADGTTRSAVFADFDGDGHADMLTSNAPYFGIWWGGSSAPNQLRAGQPDGSFGDDVLPTAVTNDPGDLWKDALGRANKDFKGVVVRDFDGDGKPDIILSAFSDIWDNVGTPPLATADPAGAAVDADGDGVADGGWQGDWKHGIVVLHNTSSPGHIAFEDVSATAIDNAFGSTDQMHVYVTVPADIDNDGDLDLLVSGPRYFFAASSLTYTTDRVRVYRNDSTPGTIRFTNITADTGMDALNADQNLPALSDGMYPVVLPGQMLDGSDFVMTPLFSAAAALDIDNDGWVDWVLIDRQLVSRNPLTNVEFNAWVFLNDGHGHFTRVAPSAHGVLHTGREISYADLDHDGKLDLVLANTSGVASSSTTTTTCTSTRAPAPTTGSRSRSASRTARSGSGPRSPCTRPARRGSWATTRFAPTLRTARSGRRASTSAWAASPRSTSSSGSRVVASS